MSNVNWNDVAATLQSFAKPPVEGEGQKLLDCGQRRALARLACRIRRGTRMTLLADEVGMGKTRIAAALIEAVKRAGGRAAVILPPGLGAQWRDELKLFDRRDEIPLLPLRSYQSFIEGFSEKHRDSGTRKTSRNARRHQRELPKEGWSNEDALMISHSFAGMRFPENEGWRRHLLGAVLKRLGKAVPEWPKNDHETMRAASRTAAKVIVRSMADAGVNRRDRPAGSARSCRQD